MTAPYGRGARAYPARICASPPAKAGDAVLLDKNNTFSRGIQGCSRLGGGLGRPQSRERNSTGDRPKAALKAREKEEASA